MEGVENARRRSQGCYNRAHANGAAILPVSILFLQPRAERGAALFMSIVTLVRKILV
jgi:hypothetical protein